MNKALLILSLLSIFFLNFTFPSQTIRPLPFNHSSTNETYLKDELGLDAQEILALDMHLEYFDQSIAFAKETYRNNPALLRREVAALTGLRKSGIRQLLGAQRADVLIAYLKKQQSGIAANTWSDDN